MIITDIKKIDSKKCLICIDYEPAFALYNSEIRRYKLKTEENLPKEVYDEILWEVLVKRCRERVGYILGKSDKSIYEIKMKLKQGYYPDEIIETVVEEFQKYSYLDDERYSVNYAKNNIRRKSINKIKNELFLKGISKDLVNNALNEIEEDNLLEDTQQLIIEKEFYKKKYDFVIDDKVILGKIISSLRRKGFEFDDIMRVYNSIKKEKIC